MADLDALKAAEAALDAAKEAVVAAEASTPAVAEPAPAAASTYLGHVGEPAVKGKDF